MYIYIYGYMLFSITCNYLLDGWESPSSSFYGSPLNRGNICWEFMIPKRFFYRSLRSPIDRPSLVTTNQHHVSISSGS